MFSNQYFENDTVIEDLLLNITEEDIVIYDSVCIRDQNPLSREHIISGRIAHSSDLIANDVFRYHSVFYKLDFLIKNNISIAGLFDYHQVNLLLANAILNNKCECVHIPMPVLHIDGTKSELDNLYSINYNDKYQSKLAEIVPLFFNDYKILHELIEIQKNDEQKMLPFSCRFADGAFKPGAAG